MQRNNLSNINTNKVYQDKLSTQMSTQKKVNRPSDDPVVSIRALRLRSNVTEVTQYYSKNIPDAESWLDVTEDALKNHKHDQPVYERLQWRPEVRRPPDHSRTAESPWR